MFAVCWVWFGLVSAHSGNSLNQHFEYFFCSAASDLASWHFKYWFDGLFSLLLSGSGFKKRFRAELAFQFWLCRRKLCTHRKERLGQYQWTESEAESANVLLIIAQNGGTKRPEWREFENEWMHEWLSELNSRWNEMKAKAETAVVDSGKKILDERIFFCFLSFVHFLLRWLICQYWLCSVQCAVCCEFFGAKETETEAETVKRTDGLRPTRRIRREEKVEEKIEIKLWGGGRWKRQTQQKEVVHSIEK